MKPALALLVDLFVFGKGGGFVVLNSIKTEMQALNCLCSLATLSGELDSLRVSYSKLFEAGNWNNKKLKCI